MEKNIKILLTEDKVGAYAKKEVAFDFPVKGQNECRLIECIMRCSSIVQGRRKVASDV